MTADSFDRPERPADSERESVQSAEELKPRLRDPFENRIDWTEVETYRCAGCLKRSKTWLWSQSINNPNLLVCPRCGRRKEDADEQEG